MKVKVSVHAFFAYVVKYQTKFSVQRANFERVITVLRPTVMN